THLLQLWLPKARSEMAPGLPVSHVLRMFPGSTSPTPSHIRKSITARRKRSSLRELLVAKLHRSALGIPPTSDMTSKPTGYTSKKRFPRLVIRVSTAAAESPGRVEEFVSDPESSRKWR